MTQTTKRYRAMFKNQGSYATAKHLKNNGYSLAYSLYILKAKGE